MSAVGESRRSGALQPTTSAGARHCDAGKAMFQMMGVFAEFGRSMIQDESVAALRGPRARANAWAAPRLRPMSKRLSARPWTNQDAPAFARLWLGSGLIRARSNASAALSKAEASSCERYRWQGAGRDSCASMAPMLARPTPALNFYFPGNRAGGGPQKYSCAADRADPADDAGCMQQICNLQH
jgi:hypothetical protein